MAQTLGDLPKATKHIAKYPLTQENGRNTQGLNSEAQTYKKDCGFFVLGSAKHTKYLICKKQSIIA